MPQPSFAPSTLASTIGSSLIESDDESEDEDNSSQLSFATTNSTSSTTSTDQFLTRLFGDSHLIQLARVGMKVGAVEDESETAQAILESAEHGTRTLYCSPSADQLDREGLVDLMERAEEEHECNGIVICLDKKDSDLEETLHSLLYVGGAILSPEPLPGMLKFSSEIVMVGLDL